MCGGGESLNDSKERKKRETGLSLKPYYEDAADRIGDWFLTFTGVRFYPEDPRPEDIDVLDIAHALAHVCRYGGHSSVFYSVAEHSVRVSKIVPPNLALVGLLHDAEEAYFGDMVRPLKYAPGLDAYRALAEMTRRVIFRRFGLQPGIPSDVKDADNLMLHEERARLYEPEILRANWPAIGSTTGPTGDLYGWPPDNAMQSFLIRFHEMTNGQFRPGVDP